MDIQSYLLGKKNGGGQPSGDRDWKQIGYSSEPQLIGDGFNYAKQIYDNWDSSITTMESIYDGNLNIVYMPKVDTSNVTTCYKTWQNCTSLWYMPSINTSNVSIFSSAFYMCYGLNTIERLDFSSVENIGSAFGYCYALQNVGGFKDVGEAYSTTGSANYTKYRLSLSNSNILSHTSLMNVINDLYDIATKGCNTQSLQIGNTNLAKLTAEEIAIATNKGWTVS